MTSIDVLPMPVVTTAPTPGSPGTAGQAATATGAPVADPALPGTEAEAPADAFAALLAAVVAAAVPQATPDVAQVVEVPTDVAPVLPAAGVPVPVEASVVVAAAVVAAPATPAAPAEPIPNHLPGTTADDAGVATGEAPPVTAAPPPEPLADVPAPSAQPTVAPAAAAEPDVAAPDAPQPVEDRPARPEAMVVEQAAVAGDDPAVAPTPSVDGAAVDTARPDGPRVAVDLHATATTAGVAPTANTTVDAPAPVAAPAPAPAPTPPPARQVIAHVSPLLEGPDGTYELTLRLHPEELGGVSIDVRLAGGEVSLSMRAETQVGHAALRESLPALRAELEAAGVAAGTLDLGNWTGEQAGTPHDTPGRRASGAHHDIVGDVLLAETDPTAATVDDSAVDVRM